MIEIAPESAVGSNRQFAALCTVDRLPRLAALVVCHNTWICCSAAWPDRAHCRRPVGLDRAAAQFCAAFKPRGAVVRRSVETGPLGSAHRILRRRVSDADNHAIYRECEDLRAGASFSLAKGHLLRLRTVRPQVSRTDIQNSERRADRKTLEQPVMREVRRLRMPEVSGVHGCFQN